MKKYPYITLTILTFLIVNIYFYFNNYQEQLSYHKDLLINQAEITGSKIEYNVSTLKSDLNYILFVNTIQDIFLQEDIKERGLSKFQLFYSKYHDVIEGIRIYDKHNNVLSIYKNKVGRYLADYYVSHNNRELHRFDKTVYDKGKCVIYQPYFHGDSLYGNVVLELDLKKYIEKEFKNYYQSKLVFQWIMQDTTIISNNYPGKDVNFNNVKYLAQALENDESKFVKHNIITEGEKHPIITAFYPVSILNQDLGIGFSQSSETIMQNVVQRGVTITLMSFIFVILSLVVIYRYKPNAMPVMVSELSFFNHLFNNFPCGVIIADEHEIINKVNSTAQDMLQISSNENIIGSPVKELPCFSSGDELGEHQSFDKTHVYSLKNGTVIFIFDNEVQVGGDNEHVYVLVDITSIDKNRKQERAENTAKSDFLAVMTHEIRTPMSGIIGMANALANENLNEQQLEYVDIVQKSAKLLMMLINDILDYSKIEAGKMMLEEIPFILSKEIKYAIDVFKPIAHQKNIQVNIIVDQAVPDNIVGDPYRLRQVIANLISNAVKFTNEGEIQIRVKLVESYDSNLTLLFEVEDTGIGMSKENTVKIFQSYSQADQSVTRKYGGTGLGTSICKQLVTLMNGEIWVGSPGGISKNPKYPGSIFSFTIEAYADEQLNKKINTERVMVPGDLNMYVVLPDESLKEFFNVFEKKGYKINYGQPDENLIDTLIDAEDDFELLVLFDTPDYDGFELAQSLHKANVTSNCRVLMLGKNDRHGNYIQSKRLGIDKYMIEPYEHNDIERLISKHFTNIEFCTDESDYLNMNLKILIAEDNIFNQKVAQTIFRNIGFEIDIANDGEEALGMINVKDYDLFFTDLQMPKKDGWEVTRDLRETGFKKPIIAMTAEVNDTIKKDVIKSGMDDYITKPFEVKTMKNMLIKFSMA
ncbi:ATP-binding protein [Bacteroidales bacterium]|nr:ATP-binding protein [Bacteroidales bacterium]